MSIYEPAAQIAEEWLMASVDHRDQSLARQIMQKIRALPNPPSEVPVFTAEDMRTEYNKSVYHSRDCFADLAMYVNARLATFRPAPPGEPDLEKMQEAFIRAHEKYQNADERETFYCVGAKYLAAQGFRLGDAPNATAEAYDSGFAAGRKSSGMVSGDTVRDLIGAAIDAAVLTEREGCASAMRRLQENCPDSHAGQTLLMAYKYAEEAIRARTTNPEIAQPPSGDPAGLTPLPGAGGDADRALLQRIADLENALLQVAQHVRPLSQWGGSVGVVMTSARKHGWKGNGK